MPLSFAPGEAYQFDWSHEIVVLKGVTTIVKVAHLRLCHSRMPFVRAYPRESQEIVFDGPSAGAGRQPTTDAMGGRLPSSRGLVEPVACTPGAGWEKRQVENPGRRLQDLSRPV